MAFPRLANTVTDSFPFLLFFSSFSSLHSLTSSILFQWRWRQKFWERPHIFTRFDSVLDQDVLCSYIGCPQPVRSIARVCWDAAFALFKLLPLPPGIYTTILWRILLFASSFYACYLICCLICYARQILVVLSLICFFSLDANAQVELSIVVEC